MKETLDDNSRQAIVSYRIEKSEMAFKEADLLASNGLYDSAVTRLYYACYYMASALLIKNGIEATTHAGIKRMLALNFIASGRLDQKYIRSYSNLMNGRQISDYEDFIFQNQESYNKYRKLAEEFCLALKNLF